MCVPDGACVLRWHRAVRSTVLYDTLDNLLAVHGHDGATTVEFLDDDAGGGDDSGACRFTSTARILPDDHEIARKADTTGASVNEAECRSTLP